MHQFSGSGWRLDLCVVLAGKVVVDEEKYYRHSWSN